MKIHLHLAVTTVALAGLTFAAGCDSSQSRQQTDATPPYITNYNKQPQPSQRPVQGSSGQVTEVVLMQAMRENARQGARLSTETYNVDSTSRPANPSALRSSGHLPTEHMRVSPKETAVEEDNYRTQETYGAPINEQQSWDPDPNDAGTAWERASDLDLPQDSQLNQNHRHFEDLATDPDDYDSSPGNP